jgi:mRNA interferase MazF
MNSSPSRGDVWLVDLDPTTSREQRGTRPVLVVSVAKFNTGPAELVVVIPITTTDRGIPTHIALESHQGGLPQASFAMAEQIRCVSKERLSKLYGRVDSHVMSEVGYALSAILDL